MLLRDRIVNDPWSTVLSNCPSHMKVITHSSFGKSMNIQLKQKVESFKVNCLILGGPSAPAIPRESRPLTRWYFYTWRKGSSLLQMLLRHLSRTSVSHPVPLSLLRPQDQIYLNSPPQEWQCLLQKGFIATSTNIQETGTLCEEKIELCKTSVS